MVWAPAVGIAATPTRSSSYPGPAPGPFTVRLQEDLLEVSNGAIAGTWQLKPRGLPPPNLLDVQAHRSLQLTGEVFQIMLDDGSHYRASDLNREGQPRILPVTPEPAAARLAARHQGHRVEIALKSADNRIHILWRLLATEGANYLRQEIAVTAAQGPCVVREVLWLNDTLPGARTLGQVDGSPVVAGEWFLGSEDPQAQNLAESVSAEAVRVRCRLPRDTPLNPGEPLEQSLVIGVVPSGQVRRGFQRYLERERAHPFRPFLHYNSWYDIAWQPFALNETNCLEAIQLLGERFVRGQGAVLDAIVFDDGWDDPRTLWDFHSGFPRGFAPLADACRRSGTRLGVWLSPFGGYGEPREQRLRFGRQQGYETNHTGFSLAGPKYYAAFKAACVRMIRDYGVNHFKFDGIATGMYASGGGEYVRDTEAMRRLMLELRREDPRLYINLTTGSWPSPFWLRYADSVWRQGDDMNFTGKGTRQQQWLTYRDQETYRNIVRKSPLFPLNSLMTQGVAYSRQGYAGEPSFNSRGFKEDVRAFFGSGTGLQELYIQPDKLTPEDWRVLAEAAAWSRTNAHILADSHWIGGDPSKLEVYGWGSWSPPTGIITLRNPADREQDFDLDLNAALELPDESTRSWNLRSPWPETASRPVIQATIAQPVRLRLDAFEVLTLEARPAGPNPAASPTVPMTPDLIPQPASLATSPSYFEIRSNTKLFAPGSARLEGRKLADWLAGATGLRFEPTEDVPAQNAMVLELHPALASRLGPEGYLLEVTPDRVHLRAGTDAGLFYAGVTLRQLLPPEAFGKSPTAREDKHWTVPCLVIEDYPGFAWRGLLLDVARHFQPVAVVKRFIDMAALHKFNRLQLHLTDDQGWRIEIKRYPRLTEIGSVRRESPRKRNRDQGDGVRYGPFFYSQDEIRDLVSYAAARHVTLVPEIEMPGHFRAALAAYPEFSCTGGPFEVRTQWGIEPDVLCPGNNAAIDFALGVLEEVTALFPSPFIHIGGDEAPRDRWKTCPRCQARLRAEGLTHEAQLQTSLNRRIEEFLSQRGRRLVGWDEILEGGLTPGAVVMSWRGMQGGIAAANAGHDVVMSPTSHCYFDYGQSTGPGEPECIGGLITLESVYAFDPVPTALPESHRRHILGAQGNLWTEFIWTSEDIDYFTYPRACALAEVLWTPAPGRSLADFLHRLRHHRLRLDQLGVRYRQ